MHEDAPPRSLTRIRGALLLYRVASYITGALLLLLVAEMILKYLFHLEADAFGVSGPFALVLEGTTTGVNLSLWVLIVHGWFYIVYLVSCYVLWQRMRWPLWTLAAMAAGGVVPFMSFVTEHIMVRRARSELSLLRERDELRRREDRELEAIEASLSDQERAALDAEIAAELDGRLGRGAADGEER